jgi:hypothetical protein
MIGPRIIARTISANRVEDKHGNLWQYNPWSDHHSKVSCWAALLDLLLNCDLMRRHAQAGKIAFGINHQMSDFRMDRSKDLDLVICTPRENLRRARTFLELGEAYRVVLDSTESGALAELPILLEAPIGVVHLALEAKATMTEHVKALPRLYDELTSSHLCIHGSTNRAIAVGLSIINAGSEFISPKNNPWKLSKRRTRINSHAQPYASQRTIEKLKQIPRRTNVDERGFDALGVVMLSVRNDGSPVELVTGPPAPDLSEILHYDSMIRRAVQLYEARFPHV